MIRNSVDIVNAVNDYCSWKRLILVLRNEGYSMWEIAKKLQILYNAVYYSLHRTAQTVSNQNRKRSGRPRCTTGQEDKYIRVSSLRNRHLTSPQLAVSLNSTRKTAVSTRGRPIMIFQRRYRFIGGPKKPIPINLLFNLCKI